MEISALNPELTVDPDREREIDPESDPLTVRQLLRLSDGRIVAVLSKGLSEDTCVYIVQPEGGFSPVSGLSSVDWAWQAGDRLLIQTDGGLHLVSLDGEISRVTDLPEGITAVDAAWCDDGLRAVALSRGVRTGDPLLYPSERERDVLWSFTSTNGWTEIGPVLANNWSLRLSRNGSRCAWREAINPIPEEALRGEIVTCDLSSGEISHLTKGAGQARSLVILPDGSGVVYHANRAQDRPITTNLSLWLHKIGEAEPVRLTDEGRTVVDFDWLDDACLWVSYIEGVDRKTEIVSLDGSSRDQETPVASNAFLNSDGSVCFDSHDRERMPYVSAFGKTVAIEQPESLDDLRVRSVSWKASDGLDITGVMYESKDLPDGTPLLVRAHGGPAGEVEATRTGAIRHRHLIRTGYRILEPAFRGSLGFGDDFLGANIGCQGEADLDDIVTGVDHLIDTGVADPDRVGIFGGSYGGYMTLRAAAVTDRFKTGVALYGFIDNRWMTLETGDFTYENEYIAPVTWPLGNEAVKADVFSRLHDIDCPILLLHGDQDPICALSQSKIVYRALEDRGVPTGLVVYPGEGHGFRKPEHRKDCARRTLAWFEQFLPV